VSVHPFATAPGQEHKRALSFPYRAKGRAGEVGVVHLPLCLGGRGVASRSARSSAAPCGTAPSGVPWASGMERAGLRIGMSSFSGLLPRPFLEVQILGRSPAKPGIPPAPQRFGAGLRCSAVSSQRAPQCHDSPIVLRNANAASNSPWMKGSTRVTEQALHSHRNVRAAMAPPTSRHPTSTAISVQCWLHGSPNHSPFIRLTT